MNPPRDPTVESLVQFYRRSAQPRGVTAAGLEGVVKAAEKGTVKKARAKGDPLLVSYRSGKPEFALDPQDLQDKGAVDEAVVDVNDKVIGFCKKEDRIAVKQSASASAKPTPRQTPAQPVAPGRDTTTLPTEDVKKAYRILDRAVANKTIKLGELRFAADILRRASGLR